MAVSVYEQYRQLLLADNPNKAEVREFLAPVGFDDWRQAHQVLLRLADNGPARPALLALLPNLLLALAGAANPDRVLVNFERFAASLSGRADLFQDLAHTPRAIEILVTLFAGSQFLTEILLRHPEYFQRLARHKNLAQTKTGRQIYEQARNAAGSGECEAEKLAAADALRCFQRGEMLRIGACDLLGLFDLPTTTAQLSCLADSLIQACLDLAAAELGIDPAGFAVIGMGKLGGGELNYSSDIDLVFLAAANAHQYWRLGQRLIDILARVTPEGFLYRVDMRLRPWGRDGALVNSVEGHLAYLRQHAGLWEKQALLKARPVAGDRQVGADFMGQAEPLLFVSLNEAVRADVRAMKQRIEAQLRRSGRAWGEVKLGEGSIRDVEFVTQYLQLAHGGAFPELRSGNTLEALARLAAGGFISAGEYGVLHDGYILLRTVEHHLQLMHYRQTHILPNDADALKNLARRLGFQGGAAGAQFVARYQQHSRAIRTVYQRYLESDEAKIQGATTMNQAINDHRPKAVDRHLTRMPASYAHTFSEFDIERHAELVGRLDEDNPVEVEAVPLDKKHWRVTVVGYDYLGELSVICGLLFVYGFDIVDGHVFSYGRLAGPASASTPTRRRPRRQHRPLPPAPEQDRRQKIVDVFTVSPVKGEITAEAWQRYKEELAELLGKLRAGEQREAQGHLAKRVAVVLRETSGATARLYPVDIEIDNDSDERHTVLRIDAPDTIGFLYEFTNALALNGVNIRRMTVETIGQRVRDTLYVTNTLGQKITSADKQRELRAATALIKHFTHLLPNSPNPELALLHFHQFLGQLFMRPDWADELTSLERPEVMDTLARLLGVSDFLWNDFLRMQYANLFPVVRDVETLSSGKTRPQLEAELAAALQAAAGPEARRVALNDFKDREMFRVDMRQIQGHITGFGQFSAELTDLAEVVVTAAYHLCREELEATFGQPRLEDGRPCPLSVCALGKSGGRELGFASDIELMFVFAGNGQTSGPQVISTFDFYTRLVHEVDRSIRSKREGIFEIDLRLRPYGRAGSPVVSLDAFRHYFGPGGDAWPYERQALVKLRPIAGDAEFGREVVALRDSLIYDGEPFDVAAMRAMRERQVRQLITGGTVNAKFSPGGLVDVEYLVQGLQIRHGHQNPGLRLTNTREAMTALAAAGILAPDDFERLRAAHVFLRRLINALRMVRGNAKDLTVPPEESDEFAYLARRLDYGDHPARLQDDLARHTAFVQELSARLLG